MLTLHQADDGVLRLRRGEGPLRPVLTAAQAAKRLGISRRQVYRLMTDHQLGPVEKVLGEWLLEERCVDRMRENPPSKQPIPGNIALLFADYPIGGLNAGRDRVLVMSRILGEGGLEELGWLGRRYGPAMVRRYLEREGRRALGPGRRRLWAMVFAGAEPPPNSGLSRRHGSRGTVKADHAARLLDAALARGRAGDWTRITALCRRAGAAAVLEAAASRHPQRPGFILESARGLAEAPGRAGGELRLELAAYLRRALAPSA